MRNKSPGFTLMELLLVVLIIGVISTLVIPRVATNGQNAREKACFHNRSEINFAVERWSIENGGWPADDLSDIANHDDYFPDGLPSCPVSGHAYRLDPTTHRVIGHDGSSGGKGGSSHTP